MLGGEKPGGKQPIDPGRQRVYPPQATAGLQRRIEHPAERPEDEHGVGVGETLGESRLVERDLQLDTRMRRPQARELLLARQISDAGWRAKEHKEPVSPHLVPQRHTVSQQNTPL